MEITAAMVNALREKTGVGMMQCKKALVETAGDMEQAIELLRKQGAAVATKRADKEAKEGIVFLGAASDRAVAVELNCETDFVAKSDDFKKLGNDVLSVLLTKDIADIEALKAVVVDGLDIGSRINEILAKIGENIGVRRFAVVPIAASDVVAQYSHMGGKIGVLVKLTCDGSPKAVSAVAATAKDLAMQVAAFSPVAIDESDVPADAIAKEREIYREQIANEGKTKPEFIERQVDGRIKKYLQEVSLVNQIFVKDQKTPISEVLKKTATEQGLAGLKVVQFVRMEMGK